MFFFFAITQRQREVDQQRISCPSCQNSEMAHVFEVYQVLMIFFIPVWKWGRRYIVRFEDCGSVYEWQKTTDTIQWEDLKLLQKGSSSKICPYCLSSIDASYTYCPHCGKPMHTL